MTGVTGKAKAKFLAAAKASLARGDALTAVAWYEMAGEELSISQPVRENDSKQMAEIAANATKEKAEHAGK